MTLGMVYAWALPTASPTVRAAARTRDLRIARGWLWIVEEFMVFMLVVLHALFKDTFTSNCVYNACIVCGKVDDEQQALKS